MVRDGDLLVFPRRGASKVWRGGWRPLAVVLFVTVLIVASAVPAMGAEPVFGIKNFKIEAIKETKEEATIRNGVEGTKFVNVPYSFSQAGGRPWAIATSAEFEKVPIGPEEFAPVHDPKDIVATLPPGLIGNPLAVPRCPLAEALIAKCPLDTVVGWYRLDYFGNTEEFAGPVVEAVPSVGESAEFVLENTTPLVEAILTAHLTRVENPQTKKHEYAFTVVSKGVPQIGIVRFEVTVWGVPADESHSEMRGRFCKRPNHGSPMQCFGTKEDRPAGIAPVAFWSYGSNCAGGPETATLKADSWQEPGTVKEGRYEQYVEATTSIPAPTGCNKMSFGPLIEMLPETTGADEPVGTQVNVKVPQTEQPGSTATPDLRDATTTLPEGLSINPGVVAGVQACEESGPSGINFDGPESEEVGPSGELQLAPGHCPAASTVGTAEAITPLLNEPVKGHVYLARPLCGGTGQSKCTNQDALDGNLYQLYLELGGEGELANTGINIKARGFTQANPATGQLTTKFLDNPQTPFSELRIHLNGGPRAPLANPAACGPAVTTADFTPWSAPGITPEGLFVPGTPDATPSSYYTVSGCANPPGLAPGFSAGTVSPQAGQFSTFTMNLSRKDREQYIKGIQVHTPPGLLGMLSSVPLCSEAQANNPEVYGECTASKIGTTRVASGAGSAPFEIEGNVFLTGPYRGSPFGLSIVTHAVAGPFNLGLVVVRAQISVDPNNSTITVTADESGPYALPQILFGVPLRLQRISVNIDRPGFMFNPTNCETQQVTAKISGSQDATASVSTPFAVAGCKSLAFKPKFMVATSGHTSRARGASLDAKVSYPAGSVGKEANIAYVKVSLPKQLPSRLTTLQKACPAATFGRDPGECPSASVVGIARATTPLLPVGLTGPVYFVSHGGEQFPSLIVVLQGDGVRVDLTGTTFISKAGITSSTFKTVPDVPVGSFELYLPQGQFSALGANTNLCKVKGRLKMPTEFVAQNGAVIKQSTRIAVRGCAKRPAKHAARKARRTRSTGGAASQPHANRRAGR
jgi:hypothetical protein